MRINNIPIIHPLGPHQSFPPSHHHGDRYHRHYNLPNTVQGSPSWRRRASSRHIVHSGCFNRVTTHARVSMPSLHFYILQRSPKPSTPKPKPFPAPITVNIRLIASLNYSCGKLTVQNFRLFWVWQVAVGLAKRRLHLLGSVLRDLLKLL